MNYVKKLNLHWFCTQNHILEPFSVRRACTKSYVTSEPYPRASQIWCQNVRETWKKKVIKCRGESFARCRVIARNVEGGGLLGPPPVFLGLRPFRFDSGDHIFVKKFLHTWSKRHFAFKSYNLFHRETFISLFCFWRGCFEYFCEIMIYRGLWKCFWQLCISISLLD